ncbi:MAG: hypothetical protein PVG14_07800 [Anaerolineales bacterium]|jgi:mono/diheme cytochrome c family protein
MKIKTFVLLIVIFFILIIIGCGPAATPEPTPTPEVHQGESIMASKCIGCHELNRIENATYDKEGWKLTVDRMVLSGAQLTDEQVELVVDYLALTYPKE